MALIFAPFIHFFCWILYALVLLCSSSFLIPFRIWKYIVVVYVYLFKPKLGDSLTVYDSMFAVDEVYKRSYATNVKILVLEGDVGIEDIRNGFISNILSATDDKGNPRFERLYQIPESFGGFYFWKLVEVDVKHQIRESDYTFSQQSGNHETELNIVLGGILSAPFRQGHPIWEVILFPRYKINQSVLVFRFHHSLGDGYTFNHLIDRLIQKHSAYYVRNCRKEWCCDKTSLLLTAGQKTLKLAAKSFIHGDFYTKRKIEATGVVSMTTINLETMKKIRRATKSHFATVGMSLLAGALRRCFLDRNLPEEKLPKFISVMHSLPRSNHPINKMVNHWGVGLFNIPMKPKNSLDRLFKAEAEFNSYISGQYEYLIKRHVLPMLGMMPTPILKWIWSFNFGTATGFTSIPGYENEAFLLGKYKILDIFKVFGLQWRESAVTGAIYTHNGKVSFAIYANKDIIPDQATIDRVVKVYLHEELNQLLVQCGLEPENNNLTTTTSVISDNGVGENNNLIPSSYPEAKFVRINVEEYV